MAPLCSHYHYYYHSSLPSSLSVTFRCRLYLPSIYMYRFFVLLKLGLHFLWLPPVAITSSRALPAQTHTHTFSFNIFQRFGFPALRIACASVSIEKCSICYFRAVETCLCRAALVAFMKIFGREMVINVLRILRASYFRFRFFFGCFFLLLLFLLFAFVVRVDASTRLLTAFSQINYLIHSR